VQDLLQTLQDHDLGHLKVIAELWGFDVPPGSSQEIAPIVAVYLSTPEFISEIEESLPKQTREVLQFVLKNEGRVALSDIVRSYGQIREMGSGRRDREKPWRNPISPLEDLWYRGLCAKAFIETPTGAQEYLFIPNEIKKALSSRSEKQEKRVGHLTNTPSEVDEADMGVVEDITTLLAYLRKSAPQSFDEWHQLPDEIDSFFHRPESTNLLLTVLVDLGVVHPTTFEPNPSATKSLLELSSSEILAQLFNAWRKSTRWNDLAHISGLSASNDIWPNDPLTSRGNIIDFLTNIPEGDWWDLEGFTSDIRTSSPGFQRPAGDFDSWYIFRSKDGEFLRGFENWDQIEGNLIRYLLAGPLHWFGLIDIGKPPNSNRTVAFRLTPYSGQLFHGQNVIEGKDEDGIISMLPDGLIRASSGADRAMRYQIARFTDWVAFDRDEYSYRISPKSLQLASERGLGLEHFRSILESACENVPPTISQALTRWDDKGVEARVERKLILRVEDHEILKSLLSNPRTSSFILETLSPTSAIIREASQIKLYEAAAQTGLFIDLTKED
jgi:hypothetical protein